MDNTLVLASNSAVRHRLLESARVPFRAIASHVDEAPIKINCRARQMSPTKTAMILARAKAKDVSKDHPDNLVLGADQILTCGELWFDKPLGGDEARDNLKQLAGRAHQLINAAVIVQDGAVLWQHQDSITMVMRPLSDIFIETYINEAGDGVTQSVGGYQLEGMGSQLFDRVGGDFFSVLGLPLLPLMAFLRERMILVS